MEDILTGIITFLLVVIIAIIIVLVNTTPGKMTDENCIYYQKDIYCKWDGVIWYEN